MLVLTRYPGQVIQIGEDIFVQYKGIDMKQAKIAIHAPEEFYIQRLQRMPWEKYEKEDGLDFRLEI